MRIGHWQLECSPGDFRTNAEKVLDGLAEAARRGIEIVSFPESFLTGYYPAEAGARANSLERDGAELIWFLNKTAGFDCTFIVGFNERRGDRLFNTVLVARRGELLGTYSKAFPCFRYFTPGREFPVFRHGDATFGVLICADGGYIEPARILALKGARLLFAPHYNYVRPQALIDHFQKVRSDHTARAVENGAWFFRGNNVGSGPDVGMGFEGVAYGDSYLLDPAGEMVVRGRRHAECLVEAEVDVSGPPAGGTRRSVMSARALGSVLLDLVAADSNRTVG
ncbi:MAG: carbon-nitrogen hydrolase family protein [Kiritimatiellaeota bacterium]|nr:carbon-nitrogen hydrolase family protein [Kiritimatiellota bacterium]